MAMPAVLTHVTADDYRLSLEYVHDVSLKNLQTDITGRILVSFLTEAALVVCVFFPFYFLWRKLGDKTATLEAPITSKTSVDALQHLSSVIEP